MQRFTIAPRANLDARAKETGFEFVTIDGKPYWDETAFYGFSLAEIEANIEAPTEALADLCAKLAARIIADDKLLTRLAVPQHAWPLIRESAKRGDPSLYGRFDFCYDGKEPAKLLEYNADTPTSLFEASVFQWLWLEDQRSDRVLPSEADQFNSLHEALVERFREIKAFYPAAENLHLACDMTSTEDKGLIAYLEDCAFQAGFDTATFAMSDIGDNGRGAFVDLDDAPVQLLFKLYPWEWMFADKFSRSPSMRETRFIEPAWKSVLSTKGILPLLWEMAPNHPNLLECYFDDDPRAAARLGDHYVRKPLYSREGANVTMVDGMFRHEGDKGPYDKGAFVRQALARLPVFDGNHPVIGSWLVGGKACGMGVREDTSPITRNTSRFIPHALLP
jgi:glutathionylspermidine synthase